MKNIIKYFLLIIITLTFAILINQKINAESLIEENNETFPYDNLVKIIDYENQIYLDNKYLHYKDKEIMIEDIYRSSLITNNDIYIIFQNNNPYLLKINKKNNQIDKVLLPLNEVYDIIYFDNDIYVCGGINQNAALYNLNQDNLYVIESSGKQTFTNLTSNGSFLIVGGIKDAHDDSNVYQNVGNKSEVKSFIKIFDPSLKEIETLYFNEQGIKECFTSFDTINQNLNFLLEVQYPHGKKVFQYVLDNDYQIIERTELTLDDYRIVEVIPAVENYDYHLYIKYFNDILIEVHYPNEKIILKTITGHLIDYKLINGELIIYYETQEGIMRTSLNEYHQNYLNPLICNYFEYDELRMNHFSVKSYLEDITFILEKITPFFNRRIDGIYEARYEGLRINKNSIYITTPLIVEPYVNIIDKGIYAKGTNLFFFGDAVLNDMVINNGYVLNKEGINTLKLTNANGITTTYQFTVVNNYYQKNDTINVPYDYIINKGEFSLLLPNINNIKEVIINGISYNKIKKINDLQYLELEITSNQSITNYHFEKIIDENNFSYDINYYFKIYLLKNPPKLQINERMINKKLNLDIKVEDNDITIQDLIF